jgi:hypothetical protein
VRERRGGGAEEEEEEEFNTPSKLSVRRPLAVLLLQCITNW